MSNVTSWTETEVNTFVQAWSEVETKYPTLRCPRGAPSFDSKLYALFSKRCAFSRSPTAVNRMKYRMRTFVLFVHQFDEERRQDGGRSWFDLSAAERELRRVMLPPKVRGLTSSVNQEAFARLMKMERVQRWLGEGHASVDEKLQQQDQVLQSGSSFLSPPSPNAGQEFVTPSNSTTLGTQQGSGNGEGQLSVAAPRCSHNSSCSSISSGGDDGLPAFVSGKDPPSTLPSPTEFRGKIQQSKTDPEIRGKIKHRDCSVLLENMMKLQDTKMRRAASKLRADIEREIQRSSEMLHSIISNQFEDPESSGDVAFMTKVLNMQRQQVCERFDEFEEKRNHDEAANRSLLG
ncbi:hypothetical protein PHYPSEUDO_013043 [Phytophthora pseudosyringae]|uniref:Uncharacterized protein n=1 Tax=Phytophthora pseudosyringae TaxID=221518 RepID=A0A8T1VAN2_9STRA|nr:hypothetical protein PHYPSEUDO_013043 [Phytophthora pseudosyringae]